MRTIRLTMGVLAVGFAAACADDGADSSDTGQLKLAASQAYKNESPAMRPAKDLCLEHGWYNDGECDGWCPKGDPTDCSETGAGPRDSSGGNDPHPGDGVACTLIWMPADGKCDLTNPCAKFQDEDCQQAEDPVACTKIFKPADGKCDLSDPCAKVQDEDCIKGDEPVQCITIAYATNGKCEAAKGCESSDPVDCAPDSGVACIEIAFPANGKCEAAPGCEYTDPSDCQPVACIAIAYETNGKCEAAKGCEQNDPVDCKKAIFCPAIYIPKDKLCPPDQPCDPDCADQSVSSP